jgi:hypothetical protein
MSFITCSRKKSMPKVSVAICKKCARLKKCPDYNLFQQPLLFPDFKKEGVLNKKRTKRYQDTDKSRTVSNEEQLTLDFLAGN